MSNKSATQNGGRPPSKLTAIQRYLDNSKDSCSQAASSLQPAERNRDMEASSRNTAGNKRSLSNNLSDAASLKHTKRVKMETDRMDANSLETLPQQRKFLCNLKLDDMSRTKCSYLEHLRELFFLQNGGNLMDYMNWKKRPNPQLADFIKSSQLDSDDECIEDMHTKSDNEETKYETKDTEKHTSSTSALRVSIASRDSESSASSRSVATNIASDGHGTHQSTSNSSSGRTTSAHISTIAQRSPMSPPRQGTRQHALSAVYEGTMGSQEAIVERAKQEAQVMQRVASLRKEGLWSSRRLPKVQEPPRLKAHWDYLLEEMQWLAADFAQERKWKKAGARKIARMVYKYHQDLQQKELKAEKEEGLKLKRIAGQMARIVREFWNNIERVVQYKQSSRLEEKRKKALDIHLSFIVDQTEKYSSWLTEGLKTNSSQRSSVTGSVTSGRDDDFEPSSSDSSDDEETIAKEEAEAAKSKDNVVDEIEDLKKQSEMPIEELLKTLPPEVLKKPAEVSSNKGDDSDFSCADESDSDIGDTIEEQEKHEKNIDHRVEIDELKKEGELSIEELRKKYSTPCGSKVTSEGDDSDTSDVSESSGDTTEESDSEESEDFGTELLVDNETSQDNSTSKTSIEGPEGINDIAATAMSLQPTGYTLETTQVKVQAPFLLKHTLREYQLIGLNWMSTMHDRKLNGILADEMGLGKTIQTIALLAHLATSHGVWGPHLIVVPTSVMLNWEMELKKWCPAFKILTYYGSQKERKQKRTGWTKTNAFHVCITSYKLVIQDHQAFRRKKWRYFILDEAQNIKNFRSQRWQTLLNFSSQRRLLLTGTPLQNSLMELWSLMHFLMPHVFQSHREFKEWFANPLTGMIEGSREYNESLIRRLHKVLRPFLLRRLKNDVEKQMPQKYEHVVMCRLSKRQRFLYDDFMSRTKTKETLESGHYMSVINILMQLRKVCNHPNLFDPRPIVSPFQMEGISYHTASIVLKALDKDPLDCATCISGHDTLVNREFQLPRSAAHRVSQLRFTRDMIVEIETEHEDEDSAALLPPVSDKERSLVNKACAESAHVQARGVFQSMRQSAFLAGKVNGYDEYITIDDRQQVAPQNPHVEPVSANTLLSVPETFSRSVQPVCDPSSKFYVTALAKKRAQRRADKLTRLCRMNAWRCTDSFPVYGSDLCNAVDVMSDASPRAYPANASFCTKTAGSVSGAKWNATGYVNCLLAQMPLGLNATPHWKHTDALAHLINKPEEHLHSQKSVLDRYTFVIPPVMAPCISMHTSHPDPSVFNLERNREYMLHDHLSPKTNCLHSISTNMTVQFPELRLIQYDCGKLQTLDILLRRLKSGDHRVLIFTQMTKMLNVLEGFLNFHGHRYLRLDGTTRVEQRQALMERFNIDKRIFVFILSTRSGGIGVNLTGADTVIFYDSDWNPTMDAQAQDRCHRIGQTRDVHIYRLISEKTIEENILKKANQKRLLGDVAIEGGNFTTAFFKQQTIKDLFEEPSGLEAFAKEQNEKKKDDLLDAQMEDVKSEDKTEKEENKDGTTTMSQDQIEQALGNAEDETDVISAKVVKAEQKAELAEFDENIPWDEKEAELRKNQEVSKVEMELAMIDKELTPVERYAVNFMETSTAHEAHEELEAAEEEVTIAKEEWQLSRLKELKEEEELRAELEEDDMLFTYTQDDISSKVFVCDTTGKEMPLWTPPTPPQDDNDVYMDPSLCFMYETTIMTEAQLPAIYIKKEVRRLHCPTQSATPRKRAKVDEQTRVPKSLFDRANMIKRDAKLVKMRPGLNKPVKAGQGGMEVASPDIHYPEWLIHEDWALLQAVQMVQELPLSLYTNSTGHIINWDLVSHIVNATSRTYRSIKHCKLRYENVLVAREEGKILYDVNPRKPKKTKAIYKTKNNRPMRTSQLYVQDSGARVSTMYTMRFDYTKHLASKRQPAVRQSASLSQKFDKHLSVLSDHRVNYNSPQTPVQVAAIRADRVARDKNSAAEAANHRQQKLHAAAQQAAVQQAAQQAAAVQQQQQVAAQVVHQAQQQAAVAQAQQQVQQATAQQQQQQQQHITGVAVTSAVTGQMAVVHTAATNAQAVLSQAVLQKAVAGQVGNAQGGTVTAFAQLPDSRSIVVNTALTNAPFSSINKRVAAVNASSGVMTATTLSAVSGVSTVSAATRARAPHGTIQEVSVNTPPGTAGIATTQVRAVNAQTAQILTQAQLVAQKAANITTQGGLQHHQQIQRALTGTSGHQLILKQDTSGLKKQATIRQQPQHRFTTSEAVRQQQLRRFTTGTHQQATITAAIQQSVAGQQQATLQKAVSVTTPMIQQGTRLAVPGKQQMIQKPTEVSAQLLKRQQIRQMSRQLSPAIFASNQLQVATTQQGGTLTAVGAVGGSAQGGVSAGGISGGSVSVCTPQSIATVVKATLPSGVTVTMSPSPNVTIPVTAVSVQRHPGTQHKSQAQMSQIRLAQLARSANLKTQQKVSMSLPLAQVKGALQTGPVIIQQHPGGGQTQRQPVTVQQIQQIVRQQQQSQLSAASTQQQQQQQPQGTTVLLTQPAIGAATHTQHTLAKVTLPTASVGAIGTSVTGAAAIRAGTPVSVTATSLCGMVKPALSSTQGVVSASPLVKQMSDVVQLSAAKPPGTLTQAANVTPLTVSAQQQLKQQSHLVRQVISTAGGGSIGATATPTVGGAPGTAGGAVAAGAGVTPASITHLLSTPGGVCSSNLAQVITTGGVSITPQPSNITVKLPQAAQQPQQATPINVQHAVQQVQQQAQQQRQIITATPATSDNNVTTAAAVAQAMQQQAVRQQQQQQATVVTSEIANVQQQPQQRTVTVSAAASVASVLGQQAVAAGGVAAAAVGAGVQQPNVTTVHIQPGQVQTAAASQQASNLQQQAAQQQLQQTPKSQQNLGMRLRTPNTK